MSVELTKKAMKGRNTFTKAEFNELCELFKEKDVVESYEKKKVRKKMRNIGFYIEDFASNSGMNYEGFLRLYENGQIKTKDSDKPAKQHTERMPQSDEDFKEGLEPWIDGHSEILILGTLPGDVSIREKAYYQNKSGNSFWKLMHGLFGAGTDSKEFLLENHVALWDCLACGNRKGSTDTNFSGGEMPNKVPELLMSHPNIRRIVLNGKTKTREYFDRYFPNLYQLVDVVAVPSSSNACSITFDNKLQEWQCALTNK